MRMRFLALPLVIAGAMFGQGSTSTTTPPDPTARMEQMLTRVLQLDAGQQSQVHTILSDLKLANQGLGGQLSTLRKSLLDAVKANDPNQIDALTQQIAGLDQQLSANRAKAAGKIYAILTDSQRGVVGQGLGMLMGSGGPGGPGGFGGRGAGGRGGPPPAPTQ
jgi:Spy/CpxP family protein refolding chaperone